MAEGLLKGAGVRFTYTLIIHVFEASSKVIYFNGGAYRFIFFFTDGAYQMVLAKEAGTASKHARGFRVSNKELTAKGKKGGLNRFSLFGLTSSLLRLCC